MNCCSTNDSACRTSHQQSEGQGQSAGRPIFQPLVNVYEAGDRFLVVAEMPGCLPESIDLAFDRGTLTLRGAVAPRGFAGREEYAVGDFERTFRFRTPIDPDEIMATYEEGLLTLTLPKHSSATPRKIEVRNGATPGTPLGA